MKSVGIITLPGKFNYGNRLQNYAVSSALERCGIKSINLELSPKFNLTRYVKSLIKRILGKQEVDPEKLMSPGRIEAFIRFSEGREAHIVSSTDASLLQSLDMYVVGSDQTWNPNFIRYNEDWFFLSFARPEQRISLAPSIGLDRLNAKQAQCISKGVAGFPSLSVREKRGAELIKECSGRDAVVICDPTLTLSAEEWRAVSDDRSTPSGPYVFTYLLGGVGSEAANVLEDVTDRGCIPVVPLSDRQKPGEPDAGPAEFISLIDHASHVVTDSFHAAVFSSILQTPLTIVHREGGASMFSRLEQLSQMLGIEEKIYGSPSFDLSLAGNYDEVPEAINSERDKFMNYLEGCLDEQLPNWREGTRG